MIQIKEFEINKELLKLGFKRQVLSGYLKTKLTNDRLKICIDTYAKYGLRFLTIDEISSYFIKLPKTFYSFETKRFELKEKGKTNGLNLRFYLKLFGIDNLEQHGFFDLINEFIGNLDEKEKEILKSLVIEKINIKYKL